MVSLPGAMSCSQLGNQIPGELAEAVEGFAASGAAGDAVDACHSVSSPADMSAIQALVASVLCKRY